MVSEKIMARWADIISSAIDRDFLMVTQLTIRERIDQRRFDIPGRKFGWSHDQLVKLNEEARKTRERDLVMRQTGGTLGNTAVSLYRLAIERETESRSFDLAKNSGATKR